MSNVLNTNPPSPKSVEFLTQLRWERGIDDAQTIPLPETQWEVSAEIDDLKRLPVAVRTSDQEVEITKLRKERGEQLGLKGPIKFELKEDRRSVAKQIAGLRADISAHYRSLRRTSFEQAIEAARAEGKVAPVAEVQPVLPGGAADDDIPF